MGRDLFENTDRGRFRYEQANGTMGMDIASLSFNGPEDLLKQTEYTQPAIFIASVILAELLMERGFLPSCGAGHSLGEYSALTVAGVFSFEDAIRLVKIRGKSMQESGASNRGTMAAVIGLDRKQVTELCDRCSGKGTVVKPANFNSQNQIVISGHVSAVRKALKLARQTGAVKAMELKVSGAFHTPLMSSAKEAVRRALEGVEIREARFPVVMNVSARQTVDPDAIRQNLMDQIDHPVLWLQSIETLREMNVSDFTEVGPGRILQGLMKRIDGSLEMTGVESLKEVETVAHG